MTLTFLTNIINHHQLPVADEFYKLLGEDYHYIATEPVPEWLVKGGYTANIDRPYIIRTWQSAEEEQYARRLIDKSDVVIHGASKIEWTIKRKKENKVTFHYTERWNKNLSIRLLSPRHLLHIYKNYYRFRNKRTYLLCASAFAAKDARLYGCFPKKCFKWGYFTETKSLDDINRKFLMESKSEKNSMMWCARFLTWKHPELPVMLANRLKNKGYTFSIDMYGSGEELEKTRALIFKLGLGSIVHLRGNRPNAEIIKEMQAHSIFLFTSDRNEGWGAVVNEAMSNGCVVVAGDAVGSVPYLIQNGINGLTFRSCDVNSLERVVCDILDHKEKLRTMSEAAVDSMHRIWSPQNAARNFMELAQYALDDKLGEYSRLEGPTSWDINE